MTHFYLTFIALITFIFGLTLVGLGLDTKCYTVSFLGFSLAAIAYNYLDIFKFYLCSNKKIPDSLIKYFK